jgi:hypothetical protein
VGARIAALCSRQPDRVLAGIAVLAAACGLVVGVGEERLKLGGSGTRLTPLLIRVSAEGAVPAGARRVALSVMRARLRATEGVESVRTAPAPGRRATVLRVRLSEDPGAAEEAAASLESRLDPGPLRIAFSGGAIALAEARQETFDDLRLLLLAAPLVALLAIGALGARIALATLFASAAAVLGGGALCVAVSLLVDVSVLCLVGAAAAGLPSGVLLCALARRGLPPSGLLAAGLASPAVFAALAALGVDYLAAVALGGVLAGLLAVPLSIASVAAATSLWRLGPVAESPVRRGLERLARIPSWNPVVAAALALLVVALALVLALPLTGLEPRAFAAPSAPEVSLARWIIATAGAALLVVAIGWLAGRRMAGAVAAAVTAALAAAAAAGLCVALFQEDELRSLLDVEPLPIGVGSIAAGVTAVAAASAAQGVAVLALRRRRSRSESIGDWASAMEAGTLASGTAALTAAALLFSSLGFVRVFALVACAGFLLDLVLVRGLLGAALLSLGSRDDG